MESLEHKSDVQNIHKKFMSNLLGCIRNLLFVDTTSDYYNALNEMKLMLEEIMKDLKV